ncbi:hypothetical protein GCM10027577_47720 [Spirosoma fluminis]
MQDNIEKDFSKEGLNFDGILHNLASPSKIISDHNDRNTFSFIIPYLSTPLFSENIFRRYDFKVVEGKALSLFQENLVLADLTPIYTRRDFGKVYLNLPLLINLLHKPSLGGDYSDNESTQRKLDAIRVLRGSLIGLEEQRKFYEVNLWDKYQVDEFTDVGTDRIWYGEGQDDYEDIPRESFFGQVEYEGIKYQLPSNVKSTFREPFSIKSYLAVLFPNNKYIEKIAQAVCVCLNLNYKKLQLSDRDSKQKEHWPNNLFYLPSIKGSTKRSYQGGDDHILNSLIDKMRFKALSSTSREFINHWTQVFQLGEIQTGRIDNLNINFVEVNGRSLADVGYGYTQLTALILSIVSDNIRDKDFVYESVKEVNIIEEIDFFLPDIDRTFLLEEPESNLHPKFQSLLSDMLVSAKNKFGYQFIIETHSEYLIRKLQYLTAKGEIKPEDTVIYYFNDPNNVPAGEKQVKKINILEDGSLSDDFGPGFYDEAAHWKFELLRLKNTRKN